MQDYLNSQNITLTGIICYAIVAMIIYVSIPMIVEKIKKSRVIHKKILASASLLFFLSLLLPSPLIHGQNTNFTTHFVGGGVFTGLLWLFLKLNFKLKLSPLGELASLYFFVCGLGVANELFEFFANGIGLLQIPSNDTWWDLFANTLGGGVFWIVYRLFIYKRLWKLQL